MSGTIVGGGLPHLRPDDFIPTDAGPEVHLGEPRHWSRDRSDAAPRWIGPVLRWPEMLFVAWFQDLGDEGHLAAHCGREG